MIKVVVDTNVFISSFFGGNPRKVIDLWKAGEITLCLSSVIIEEYIEVLQRLGLQNERELEELTDLSAKGFHSLFTSQIPSLQVVEKDPDDDKFIECAVALKAKYVISGDKALQEIKDYIGVKIVNPKDFLEIHQKNLLKNEIK